MYNVTFTLLNTALVVSMFLKCFLNVFQLLHDCIVLRAKWQNSVISLHLLPSINKVIIINDFGHVENIHVFASIKSTIQLL